MWANAVTADGNCYFTWIPRYAYKITYFDTRENADAYRADSSCTTGIVGYSNIYGIVDKTSDKVIKGTVPTNVTGSVKTAGYTDYIPHPAFTFGTTQEKGVWVGKFESSKNGNGNVQIKPNVADWRSQTVSTIFAVSQNVAGTSSISADSHMIKNIEWGAAAYLANSKYGRNGTEISINNSSASYTGMSAGAPGSPDTVSTAAGTYAYDTPEGQLASTTGNIYGIYDISGGGIEYIAAYVDNGSSTLSTYGLNLINADAKYKDVYTAGSKDDAVTSYAEYLGKCGDAVYETSTSGSGNTSWYGDYSVIPYSTAPIFARGRNLGLWLWGWIVLLYRCWFKHWRLLLSCVPYKII